MKLPHLLAIHDLNRSQLESLLDDAQYILNTGIKTTKLSHTLVNLFYENSTRTRISFELAAKRLGMEVINFDIHRSSTQKGENIFDTVDTLAAMSCNIFAIRHSEAELPANIASHLGNRASVINAGDGSHEHPTQALIDMLTIRQYCTDFSQISVGIVGDIAHSRVANSDIAALRQLGCNDIRLIAPDYFLPSIHTSLPRYQTLKEGLDALDVIIVLRIQQERLPSLQTIPLETYCEHYTLTLQHLAYAKPTAIVMHPGPVNRNIELASNVADSSHSRILQQVANGVFVRMAVLKALCH